MNGKREYGDYQTPAYFSLAVCEYLKNQKKITPDVIIEPTCGVGSFIKSSLIFDAAKIVGIEVNAEYCKICKHTIPDDNVQIINTNFFTFDLNTVVNKKERVLVVGNPPWVNNSTLSSLYSSNIPDKRNFKGFKGMDAITGASNFDICEYIILQLVRTFSRTNTTIAMLCKTAVARNVFVEMKRTGTAYVSYDILEFDAKKVFGINANACLLFIEFSANNTPVNSICNVYSFDEPQKLKRSFGYVDGTFYSDLEHRKDDFSGTCCFEWRQGVKHDCAKVMELSWERNSFINGLKESINIENRYVFPLIKSSMFKAPIISVSNKYVIVTQKKVREDTSHIASDAPKTWQYLKSHAAYFAKRRSIIYKNAPEFSMFGIGDYSYAPYKVGVSGFYKKPLFSLLAPYNGSPIMTDDTSYFICFSTYDMAYVAMLILNSERVQHFLSTIAFVDAKRPYTKKVLEQIDFNKIFLSLNFSELVNTEKELQLEKYVDEEMLHEFGLLPELNQHTLF